MESLWSSTCTFPSHPVLDGDQKTNTLVIGAGMAGLLTAYMLNSKGVDVLVIEADRICGGYTKNTTAKITSQHRLIYDRLIREFGIEKAQQYASANQLAIEKYREVIHALDVSCDFETKDALVYSCGKTDKIDNEIKAAQKLGISAEFTNQSPLPFPITGAVVFHNQAQFHPLQFLRGIVPALTIYENTMALSVEGHTVITNRGTVTADHIVVATHYPFINTPGYYFMRMHQDRSYVIALENAPDVNGMYIDEAEQGYSFRNFGPYLLFGGSGHRTGDNAAGDRYQLLRSAAQDYFPYAAERYHWSAQDCMPLDGVPYIGRYSSSTPQLYVATGFQKWGMTTSMVAAMLLSDAITGQKNDFADVFDPGRFKLLPSAKNLAVDGIKAVQGLLSQKLLPPKESLDALPAGHGGIIEYNGEKIGAYKHPDGTVYCVSTKCTHLGCQLEWNPDELTWDCPCHGSRFDYRGRLLSNPAMKDLPAE